MPLCSEKTKLVYNNTKLDEASFHIVIGDSYTIFSVQNDPSYKILYILSMTAVILIYDRIIILYIFLILLTAAFYSDHISASFLINVISCLLTGTEYYKGSIAYAPIGINIFLHYKCLIVCEMWHSEKKNHDLNNSHKIYFEERHEIKLCINLLTFLNVVTIKCFMTNFVTKSKSNDQLYQF